MLRPVVQGPFVKGIIASSDPITQPKGSVSRISNLLYTVRGALTTCDGTAVVNAFDGLAAPGLRGRFESTTLFEPIGVAPYYLVLAPDASFPLGPPQDLAVSTTGSGTLPADTYFYVVTALDGAGGETPVSNEVFAAVGANSSITICWNVVPNAWAYNVYRGLTSGSEMVLSGVGLPVPQPAPLTVRVCFTDGGATPFPPGGLPVASVTNEPYVLISPPAIAGFNPTGRALVTLAGATSGSFYVGKSVVLEGTGSAYYNGVAASVVSIVSSTQLVIQSATWAPPSRPGFQNTVGGDLQDPGPVTDTTQQVVLYKMPNSLTLPIPYTDANVVALFPMCPPSLGVPPSGGTGGPTSLPGATASGGIIGMTSRIPQMAQFTNRVAMALGNGFVPQVYWDSTGSPVNPAPTGPITGVSVDAYGVVTVTTSTSLSVTDPTSKGFLPVGTNVVLAGIADPLYNGVFVVISVAITTMTSSFTVRNLAAIGEAPSSGGTWTDTATPIINVFLPAYPAWAASTIYAVNAVVQPDTPNGFYYTCVFPGESGLTQPAFPTIVGNQIEDGTAVWQNSGSSAGPAPPGAGHLSIYSGSLWLWNTYPTDSTNGIAGPTSIQMSDVDNPFSWNPVNQAFIDKDDGSDGMGLATFTISAEGIPPEGSLVAFKNFAGYQIVGVFGSSNFAIQRIRSDMGCSAPRTIHFVPGFGIMRYAHLGIANFDGVRDTLISEEVRPFLFASNSRLTADIVPIDPYWLAMSYSDLTASPAMYVTAIPVGSNSLGALTRLLCYDIVLKSWAIIDLPFSISTIYQARSSEVTSPITLFGGFSDGVLQRWQANDVLWLTGGGASELPLVVAWSVTPADTEGRTPDQKMQFRRVTVRGISNGASSLSVTPIINGSPFTLQTYPIPVSGDYEVFSGVFKNGWRFGARLSGAGPIEIDRVGYQLVDKALGTPGVIS